MAKKPEPIPEPIPEKAVVEKAPVLKLQDKVETKLEPVDLSKDMVASAQRITDLKAGRHVDDIPLHDEYWKALRKHQLSHSK